MTFPFSRTGSVVVCLALLAGAFGPGRARAQSDGDPDAPARGRAEPQAGGSDVFDDTDQDPGAPRPPRRPAAAEPPGSEDAGEPDRVETPPADESPAEPPLPPADEASAEPPPAAPVERVPAPDKAAQAKALKLVKDVFADEYRKKSVEDKLALAAKLLEQAGESGNDAATRYVMLREARDLAAGGGAVTAALSAADEIAAAFTGVDPVAMKLETLTAASKKVADPARAEAVVDGYLAVSAELLSAAELDRAVKAVAQAEPLARKAKNAELTARLNQQKKELKELVSQFGAGIGPAKAKLAKAPADPAANGTMGRFYCLAAGDWERGLPLLAKGNDPALRKMARDDLAGAGGPPAAMAGIGDGWWELGEKQAGLAKARVRGRAAHWYQQAAGELSGLARTRVEKRLALAGPDAAAGAASAGPTDKALQMLTNVVRKLPANARPREGQAWDVTQVSRWLNGQVRGKPFDAVLRVGSVNVSRSRGRDTFSAYFEPVGPVKLDGVDYRLAVSLYEQGGAPPEMVKKLKRGTHVRVRGLVSQMSAGGSGGNGVDIRNVDFWLYLDRPNLTIVPSPLAAGIKGPVTTGQRVLEKLTRKMEADKRPLRYDDWRADSSNEWLDQQFRGTAVEVVTRVGSVTVSGSNGQEYINVNFDAVGRARVGEAECALMVHLSGADDPRLKKLMTGETIRIRGILRSVRATSSSESNGTISVWFSLELEQDYTIAPVADSKRGGE